MPLNRNNTHSPSEINPSSKSDANSRPFLMRQPYQKTCSFSLSIQRITTQCFCSHLIVPDGIHAKPRLLDVQMCHAAQELASPSVNLNPTLLIIGKRQPLVGPRAWAYGVGVSSAGRRRVEADLSKDLALGTQSEGRDVARHILRVGTSRGEEVFAGVGEEDDVGAVHFGIVGVES